MPDAKHIQAVFRAAHNASSPAERARVLDEECGGDATLRQQVEALLRAYEEADSLPNRPTLPRTGAEAATPTPADSSGLAAASGRDGETMAEGAAIAGAATPPLELPARYRLEGEIARGGMGQVLRGRDAELGREIAVKVLLEAHADRTEMVERFVEEARIAGQLQHPGVAPVYDVGAAVDRRPYFTMKLVKGQTLAELLAQRQEASQDWPRLLKVFEQVAQTMAYAHSKGVIHRDLKPANVMVGAFGEVQVMDWGLAKVLIDGASEPRPSGSATASPLPDGRGSDGDGRGSDGDGRRSDGDGRGAEAGRTQAGAIIGTPAYMAPEQAASENDRIDRHSDVFGLGAVLCEILTGQPPFRGGDVMELLVQSATGDLSNAFARLDGCGADKELVTLAKACLGSAPDARPRDAGVVAGRMAAYFAGVQEKLRAAELGRVEERGRRRLTMVAAAAVLLLGALTAGGYTWVEAQQSDRRARTGRAVDEALADAARLRGVAQAERADLAPWGEALAAVQRAEGLLEQGEVDAPLRERVAVLRGELQSERAAAEEQARRRAAERTLLANLEAIRASRGEHDNRNRTDAEYAEAFRGAGLEVDAVGAKEAGAWLAARPAAVELTAYLDDWAVVRREKRPQGDWRRLTAAARAADPDPWRDTLRARAADGADVLASLRKLADDPAALDEQPAASLVLLALQLKSVAGDRERATRVLQRAWMRFPGDFWVNFELAQAPENRSGGVHEKYPRPEEAVRHLSAAVAVRPRSAMAHHNLGLALYAGGKVEEAVAVFRKAVALAPNVACTHMNLGVVLSNQGKLKEAIAAYRRAVAIEPRSVAGQANLGLGLANQGKLEEALAVCRRAVALDPKSSLAHTTLGVALHKQGKLAEAAAAHRQAVALAPRSAQGHDNLGLVLAAEGKDREALAAYRRAIALDAKCARAHANMGITLYKQGKKEEAVAQIRHAVAMEPNNAGFHDNLGAVLFYQGRLGEAVAALRQAIQLDPRHVGALANLAGVLEKQNKLIEAEAVLGRALKVDPKSANAYHGLGIVFARQNRFEEAADAFRQAVVLDPKSARAHENLGITLSRQGKFDEAAGMLRQALALEPKLANACYSLGNVLAAQGKRDEAADAFRQAIVLDPTRGEPHCNLADILRKQGRFVESLESYRRGHALGVEQSGWQYPSRQWVRAAERRVLREKTLPEVLEGKLRPSNAVERIEYAQVCKLTRRSQAAARLYGEAFAENPALAPPPAGHRYDAACCAALAAAGKGRDADGLGATARLRWRRQALTWLRGELTAWTKALEGGQSAGSVALQRALRGWQMEADLAGLRDPDEVAKLPAEEQQACRKLWADVRALLQGARQKAKYRQGGEGTRKG